MQGLATRQPACFALRVDEQGTWPPDSKVRAIIPAARIRDHLLSVDHPVGRAKARFFRRLGFTAARWPTRAEALRNQHLMHEPMSARTDEYGRTFVIRAILRGPTGSAALVVSVWFVRRGEDVPRFVTAYPGGAE